MTTYIKPSNRGLVVFVLTVVAILFSFWFFNVSFQVPRQAPHPKAVTTPVTVFSKPPLGVTTPKPVPTPSGQRSLEEAASLARMSVAGYDKAIIIGICDKGYMDIVLNYHEFAKRVPLKTLYITLDLATHLSFTKAGLISYYHNSLQSISGGESKFRSSEFNKKAAMKFEFTLRLLKLGYNVLLVDLDVVFFKNPFPYFDCKDCDIEGQDDTQGGILCIGIVFSRNTTKNLRFYSELLQQLTAKLGSVWDQARFNEMLYPATKNYGLKYRLLNVDTFPSGRAYFHAHYLEANPFEKAVAYHNNWVINRVQKEFRFREFGIWLIDKNGYYSDARRKYLTIEFPNTSLLDKELQAVENAYHLAKLLNRTLILPKFSCREQQFQCSCHFKKQGDCFCSLAERTNIEMFHQRHLNQYKEHFFLRNPNTPAAVKNSISPLLLVDTEKSRSISNTYKQSAKTLNLTVLPFAKSHDDFVKLLKPYAQYSVLRFLGLYDGIF